MNDQSLVLKKDQSLGLEADFVVRDDRRIIVNEGIIECHSYLRNFICLLSDLMGGSAFVTMIDIANASGSADNNDFATKWNFHGNAASSEEDWGIVIGTDNTAPAIADYKLAVQINHGNGAGELQYGSVAIAPASAGATDCLLPITRDFTNASAGTITVKEVGFQIKNRIYSDSSNYDDKYFLLMRDIISDPGVDVDPGNVITVTYKMRTVV